MDMRVVAVSVFVLGLLVGADAGCSKVRGHPGPMCCQGRNNTCKALGPRGNDPESKQCFCDSACLLLDDCCLDYKDTCKAENCELESNWGPYGECDTRCGWGTKSRSKRVLATPKNGGKPCDKREEKIACYGINCKVPRAPGGFKELRETGRIIPAEYGAWRNNKMYNPYKDIRKNLFEHYNSDIIDRPAYCAKFEITESRKPCQYSALAAWSKKLKIGTTVCVECQQLAMKRKLGVRCHGHGVFGKETRFNTVTVPGCHGKWVMTTRHEDCSCNSQKELSFILI